MSVIRKAFYVLKDKKAKLIFLIIIILLGSLLELLGVTAILPFINVALTPDSVFDNEILFLIYKTLGLTSSTDFLIILGITLIIVYVVKNIYVILMNNYIYKFSYQNQKELACRLLTAYLNQPFSYFAKHNSADFIRNLNEDTIYFFETIVASLQFIAELTVCILLGATLLWMDLGLTIGMGGVLVLFVLTVFRTLKRNLEIKGGQCRGYKAEMYKWILQATGGIKETKILEKEKFFNKKYESLYGLFAEDYRKYKMFAFLPRPLMETVSICTLLVIVLIKIASGADMTRFIPVLSVFAVAIFRMLPSFNRLATYVSQIMFNRSSVESIYKDLKEFENQPFVEETDNVEINFESKIELKDVSFRYPDSEDDVIVNAEMTISKGKSVALIGPSGAGKTTTADIILGVLETTSGKVLVDGVPINPMSVAWHKKIGYIPQNIFIMDDTIRNNIAFGEDELTISNEKLLKAIEGAQLKEYIDSLPDGLDTVVGERGVRLSGGQRQRIGIARALYFDPEVLVLDEATSALDNDTEQAVMEAIDNLAGSKTLLIIAHRLSTIRNCDIVYEIKDKKVKVINDK